MVLRYAHLPCSTLPTGMTAPELPAIRKEDKKEGAVSAGLARQRA